MHTAIHTYIHIQARVQGGAQGAWAPPPLEIEKQKKKKGSEQISGYFTYIMLGFQILGPPPLRIPGHAPDIYRPSSECKLFSLYNFIAIIRQYNIF